jgi:hypothetical protein
MADIGEQLITYLKTQAGVTALVGSGADARILQQESPKESSGSGLMPCICVTINADERILHSGGYTTLARADVTLTGWADTIAGRNALAAAIDAAMPDEPSGDAMGTLAVTEVSKNASRADGDIMAQDGSDQRLYVSQFGYRIWYYTA